MTPHSVKAVIGATIAWLAVATGALAQTKVDLAIFHPERNAWTTTLQWWIAEVDKATQGRVKVLPHFAGALVSMNETLKSVRDGAIPAGVVAAGAVSGQLPALAYVEAIGGLPDEPKQFVEAITALRPHLEDQFRRQGAEYLWSQGSGSLNVVCRDQHMKSIADWKGKKVRTAGRWQAEQLRELGASPVSMDPGEQYIALQNRTIDCALSVNVLAVALKLHEVAPKVTLLRSPVNLSSYIMNKALFDKLSPEDRAAMKRLGEQAEQRSAEFLAKVQNDAADQMKAQKADFYVLTDAEAAAFRKGIGPAFAKIDAQGGDAGKKIGEIVKRYW